MAIMAMGIFLMGREHKGTVEDPVEMFRVVQ